MSLFEFQDPGLFQTDGLAWIMAALIAFVVLNVMAFSSRYLAGDSHQRRHHVCVLLLGLSLMAMVFANHLLILLVAWMAANLLLTRLIVHKEKWAAARNSGLLALKTFSFGFACLAVGFWFLAESSGTAMISKIVGATFSPTPTGLVGLVLIAIAAMTQCAAWPFHRWLISSLNSPTPVSALMHAGLVNGGGFLLVRFAPLLTARPDLLHGIFAVGIVTAVVGTFWKLLQTDIKRMLACSTMGQMGFMLMQCGMGLFAPAVSHLCWHGLFKAYLFLSAGSVVQEKRVNLSATARTPLRIGLAALAGLCGALLFTVTSGASLSFADTGCFMSALAFMASMQLALGLLEKPLTGWRLAGASLAAAGAGGLYGLSLRLIDIPLAALHVAEPLPIDAGYVGGFAVIVLVWVAMVFDLPTAIRNSVWWKRIYMTALNASQPHPKTVTITRTAYQS